MKERLSRLGDLLRASNANLVPSLSIRFLLAAAACLGATYGLSMGLYAVRTRGWEGLLQLASSTIKLPLLFILTTAVTFPSLYVFNTLLGSRLTFEQTLRTVGAWIAIILAVAASLGPILGFFTVSTNSYPFMVLLNVALLGLAGLVGSASLFRMLSRAEEAAEHGTGRAQSPTHSEPTETHPQAPAPDQERALPQPGRRRDVANQTLMLWVVIFGTIGLQMAWVLRPFIGGPNSAFVLFRDTQSNAFAAIFRAIGGLLGAG